MDGTKIQAGDGVTIHQSGALIPGTVLRVSTSGRCVWYRPDVESDGSPAPVPSRWVHRALRHADGVYRNDEAQWRVELGVRLPFRPAPNGAVEPDAGSLASLENTLERIEPYLLKTSWYPMTSMMIPSVLRSADDLIAVARAFVPASDEEQARAARVVSRATELRQGFRREVPMEMSERRKLETACRATTFVVSLGDAQVEVRADRRHPELDAILANEGATRWACITATLPSNAHLPAEMKSAELHHLESAVAEVGGRCFRAMSRPDDGTPGVECVLALLGSDEARSVARRRHQHIVVLGRAGEDAELLRV